MFENNFLAVKIVTFCSQFLFSCINRYTSLTQRQHGKINDTLKVLTSTLTPSESSLKQKNGKFFSLFNKLLQEAFTCDNVTSLFVVPLKRRCEFMIYGYRERYFDVKHFLIEEAKLRHFSPIASSTFKSTPMMSSLLPYFVDVV